MFDCIIELVYFIINFLSKYTCKILFKAVIRYVLL